MDYTVVPSPQHRRYGWESISTTPNGSAMRTEWGSRLEAENARVGALSYCKYNGLRIHTKVMAEGVVFALYVWQKGG